MGYVSINVEVDSDDVLEDMGVDEVISYFGEDSVLDEIGASTAVHHFGLQELIDETTPEKILALLDEDTVRDFAREKLGMVEGEEE